MNATGAVFVTGGSGFIGGRLIRRLRRRRAPRARAGAVRRRRREGRGRRRRARPRRPLRPRRRCAPAPRAATWRSTPPPPCCEWGPREEFVRANVDGTQHVLDACREAGVRRLVHVGTEAATMAGQPLVNDRRDGAAAARLEGATTARRRRWPSRPCAPRTATASRPWWCGRASSGGRATRRSSRASSRRCAPDASAGSAAAATGPRPRTSTTSSRACVLGGRAGPRRRGLLRHRRRSGRVPRLRHRAGRHPGRRDPRQGALPKRPSRAPRPRGSEAVFRHAAPEGHAAADPLRPTGSPRWSARSTSPRRASELGYAPVRTIEDGMAELRAAARARSAPGRAPAPARARAAACATPTGRAAGG